MSEIDFFVYTHPNLSNFVTNFKKISLNRINVFEFCVIENIICLQNFTHMSLTL